MFLSDIQQSPVSMRRLKPGAPKAGDILPGFSVPRIRPPEARPGGVQTFSKAHTDAFREMTIEGAPRRVKTPEVLARSLLTPGSYLTSQDLGGPERIPPGYVEPKDAKQMWNLIPLGPDADAGMIKPYARAAWSRPYYSGMRPPGYYAIQYNWPAGPSVMLARRRFRDDGAPKQPWSPQVFDYTPPWMATPPAPIGSYPGQVPWGGLMMKGAKGVEGQIGMAGVAGMGQGTTGTPPGYSESLHSPGSPTMERGPLGPRGLQQGAAPFRGLGALGQEEDPFRVARRQSTLILGLGAVAILTAGIGLRILARRRPRKEG